METCKDIMTQSPRYCTLEDSVVVAAQLMRDEDVGAIPVAEDQQIKRLLGILTDRDIVLKVVAQDLDPKTIKVGAIMTRDPVVCGVEDSVEEAMKAMKEHQIRRIPVVDEDHRLVGIIAQADIAIRIDEAKKTGEVVREISEATH